MMQPGDNETAPSAETQAITAQLSSQLQDALTQLESYRSRQALLDRQLAELTQRNQSLEEALEKAAQEEAPDAELLAEQENQIEMLRKQLSDLRTSRQRDEGASARANSRLRAALARAISVLREDQPELAEQLEQMVRGQEEQPQQDTAPESGS
jgi:chromosome segregation ATPase